MNKCLFPLDAYVVLCPTCRRNLEWYLNEGVFNVDAESLTRDMCKQQELENYIKEANQKLVANGKNTICVLSKEAFKKG
jgi:hypothetical protein